MMVAKGNRMGQDEHGKAILWSSQGQQVMMEWEQQYMQQCVDALKIQSSDRVLEIGFGLAFSATHIQSYRPRQHTIIECDQAVLVHAREFAGRHEGVKIIEGTWQQMLPLLEQFECVFFDDYPLPEVVDQQSFGWQNTGVGARSRWHDFLDVALAHVVVGGRITGYLARELNLQRPGCEVLMTRVQVEVPDNCNYFPHKTALVPVITVVDGAAIAINNRVFQAQNSIPIQRACDHAPIAIESESIKQRIELIHESLLTQDLEIWDNDKGNFTYPQETSTSTSMPNSSSPEEATSCHYNNESSRKAFLKMLRRKAVAKRAST